jgi:hypothetical protein
MAESNAQNTAIAPGGSLAELAKLLAAQKLPPVDRWNPAHCGHSDMRIAADGTWFHMGTPIGRPALVKLFSTVLRREPDGRHVLVTPVEKLDIDVEDAAFVAVEMSSEGSGRERRLAFRLNTDDWVIAGPDNTLRFETAGDGTPRPYLHVRRGLDALVNRPVFYDLAEIALGEGGDPAGVWSSGVFFPMGAAA